MNRKLLNGAIFTGAAAGVGGAALCFIDLHWPIVASLLGGVVIGLVVFLVPLCIEAVKELPRLLRTLRWDQFIVSLGMLTCIPAMALGFTSIVGGFAIFGAISHAAIFWSGLLGLTLIVIGGIAGRLRRT